MPVRALCLVLNSFAVLGSAVAIAQCPFVWYPGDPLPGLNGPAYASITWDPDGSGPLPEMLVVGGDFTAAGSVVASRIAAWDGATWQPFGSGIYTDYEHIAAVYCLAVYNGELIAGGQFAFAGGNAAANIARWNGSSWQAVGSGTSGPVRALTVYNGELIAGGDFVLAGGLFAQRIAR